MKEEHRGKLQDQLTWLIMQVLVNNPQLHYYQVSAVIIRFFSVFVCTTFIVKPNSLSTQP